MLPVLVVLATLVTSLPPLLSPKVSKWQIPPAVTNSGWPLRVELSFPLANTIYTPHFPELGIRPDNFIVEVNLVDESKNNPYLLYSNLHYAVNGEFLKDIRLTIPGYLLTKPSQKFRIQVAFALLDRFNWLTFFKTYDNSDVFVVKKAVGDQIKVPDSLYRKYEAERPGDNVYIFLDDGIHGPDTLNVGTATDKGRNIGQFVLSSNSTADLS